MVRVTRPPSGFRKFLHVAVVVVSVAVLGLGFAYEGVWVLPLVFLVLVGSVGRALTKQLYGRNT